MVLMVYRPAAALILGVSVVPSLYFVDGDRRVEVTVGEVWIFMVIGREIRKLRRGIADGG
ncbi:MULTISPECIES: hypothetical protein [unclassified Methanoculleus]|jgi:hypothetical protein|uniref:hypothetical protein n=2 Tax=unclassified Methanoculleus TaxID=2619537 RepID=UPI00319DC01B|nr:hypothetical protein [Methanoculleus sp.]